jgi:hypothetical protein
MEQLTSLGIDPGDKDSAARYLAFLKSELADEKAVRKEDKDELQTLAWACDDLKKTTENDRQIRRPSHWIRRKGPRRAFRTLRQRTIFGTNY